MIAPQHFETVAAPDNRTLPAPFAFETWRKDHWDLWDQHITAIQRRVRSVVGQYEAKHPAISLAQIEAEKERAEWEANSGTVYDIDPDEWRQYQAELVADQRKAALFDVLASQVGTIYSNAEKPLQARRQLNEDTEVIAQAFAAQGAPAFKPATAPRMAYVGLVTGTVSEIPHVRSRCIFPIVGQMKRSKTLTALEYWLRRNPTDRFWTFTLGPRCTVSELRENFRKLHRAVSKLNAEKFMKDRKQRFIFRASEIGSLKREDGSWAMDDCGNITYHPHAHALLHGPKMPKKHFRRFLKDITTWWKARVGGWSRECGGIEKIREIVKYVGKPCDLRALCKDRPHELVQLSDALFRLKMIQPLDGLKKQIAARKKRCRRLAVTDNGIEEKADWNSRKFKILEREKREINLDGKSGFTGDLFEGKNSKPEFAKEERHAATRPMENRVLAILPSLLLAGNCTEPAVLVANYDGNLAGILADPVRRKVAEIGREAWSDGSRAKTAAALCAETARKGRALSFTLIPQLSGPKLRTLPGFDTSDVWSPPKTPPPEPLRPLNIAEMPRK